MKISTTPCRKAEKPASQQGIKWNSQTQKVPRVWHGSQITLGLRAEPHILKLWLNHFDQCVKRALHHSSLPTSEDGSLDAQEINKGYVIHEQEIETSHTYSQKWGRRPDLLSLKTEPHIQQAWGLSINDLTRSMDRCLNPWTSLRNSYLICQDASRGIPTT